MASRRKPSRAARASSLFAAVLLAAWPAPALAAPSPGDCVPPRTLVALLSLADATDHSWAVWTGADPAALVSRLLADSLGRQPSCEVSLLSTAGLSRSVEDGEALVAARRVHADVVVTGTLSEFTHEDRRERGKLWRWGASAPESRSRARVRVTLRMLDVRDGSVIIETAAARDRAERGTATVSKPLPNPIGATPATLLAEVLGEVLEDLTRTLELRVQARWQALVESADDGACVLAVGASRGLTPGQRLEVWRSGIETFDEDLLRLNEEARVGALVVTALDGPGRARARLTEGEVRAGDLVRACSPGSAPALSLRR